MRRMLKGTDPPGVRGEGRKIEKVKEKFIDKSSGGIQNQRT